MRKGTPIIIVVALGMAWGGLAWRGLAQQPYYPPPRPMPIPYQPGMPPPFNPGLAPPLPYMGPAPIPMRGPGPMVGPGPVLGPQFGPPPQLGLAPPMGPYGPMPFPAMGPPNGPYPPLGMMPPAVPGFGLPPGGPMLGPPPGGSMGGPILPDPAGNGLPPPNPKPPIVELTPPPLTPEPVLPEPPMNAGPAETSPAPLENFLGHHHDDVAGHHQGGCHGGSCPAYGPCLTELFPKGSCTFQMLTGYYNNSNNIRGEQPTYNYVPITMRWGKICCFPHCEEGCLRGAFEPMIELNGAPVTEGFGHFYVGTALLLRYNFVQPTCRLVPYVQVGAGIQYNDGYRDSTQTALGQAMEYTANAQVGLRYFLKPNCSLDIEGGLIHISDLNQASRNDGINSLGGSVGFTYYFPVGHR